MPAVPILIALSSASSPIPIEPADESIVIPAFAFISNVTLDVASSLPNLIVRAPFVPIFIDPVLLSVPKPIVPSDESIVTFPVA